MEESNQSQAGREGYAGLCLRQMGPHVSTGDVAPKENTRTFPEPEHSALTITAWPRRRRLRGKRLLRTGKGQCCWEPAWCPDASREAGPSGQAWLHRPLRVPQVHFERPLSGGGSEHPAGASFRGGSCRWPPLSHGLSPSSPGQCQRRWALLRALCAERLRTLARWVFRGCGLVCFTALEDCRLALLRHARHGTVAVAGRRWGCRGTGQAVLP